MKILVTGGLGFIGSNFINNYLKKYPNDFIVNLDRNDYCSNVDNVQMTNNYKLIICDICSKELVFKILNDYNISIVYHFAAQSHVDNSFGNSLQFTVDNILGTHTLLECCHLYGKLIKFIHMSTDEVYGEVDIHHTGCIEKSILNPTNPYAATKAGAEALVHSYHYSFKLPVIICRGNNVYGANQYHEKLIPKFIKHLHNNQKCTVHGHGHSRRNFIHVDDVFNAIDIIARRGKLNHVYNIGTTNEYSVLEILEKLVSIMKPGDDFTDWIEYVGDRHYNDFRYAVDSSSLKNLGWIEFVDFENSLHDLVKVYE
jgi:dTDP-glucose 4,6-dehydratase